MGRVVGEEVEVKKCLHVVERRTGDRLGAGSRVCAVYPALETRGRLGIRSLMDGACVVVDSTGVAALYVDCRRI